MILLWLQKATKAFPLPLELSASKKLFFLRSQAHTIPLLVDRPLKKVFLRLPLVIDMNTCTNHHGYSSIWLDGRPILRLKFCKLPTTLTKFYQCKQMLWSDRIYLFTSRTEIIYRVPSMYLNSHDMHTDSCTHIHDVSFSLYIYFGGLHVNNLTFYDIYLYMSIKKIFEKIV